MTNQLNEELLNAIKDIVVSTQFNATKEWLSLKEGAEVAGVSYNTFMKFRERGLKIATVDGIKRVSRTEINTFFENYTY